MIQKESEWDDNDKTLVQLNAKIMNKMQYYGLDVNAYNMSI